MTDTTTQAAPATRKYFIGIAGRKDVAGRKAGIEIEAASFSTHSATEPTTIQAADAPRGLLVTTFKDADGDIILQAPAESISFILRLP